MFAQILNLFRPQPVRVNNVFTLEKHYRAQYNNRVDRAIRNCELRGKFKARAEKHKSEVWAKHLDRVSGYELVAYAEQHMLDYIDEQVRFQRNDQKPAPIRLWAANSFDGAA